jgi:hypothetical protein
MSQSEDLVKGTQRGRVARIEALETKIKESRRIALTELYRYALRTLNVSKRIVDQYIEEMILKGSVRREAELTEGIGLLGPEENVYLVWIGEK